MKKSKAITLVALIITIIILLILATVSISLIINSGIINNAKNSVDKYSDEEIAEQIKLAYSEHEMAKFTDNNIDMQNYIQTRLQEVFNQSISVQQEGKNIKIFFNDINKKYKYYSNGKVREVFDPTNTYWRFEDGIIYFRATNLEGYNKGYDWGQHRKDIEKVIIEELVAPTSAYNMFYQCYNLKKIENLKNLHTENITTMHSMFDGCGKLEDLDVSNFDTSNVTSMGAMFLNCKQITSLDVSNFDTSNVTYMAAMFQGLGTTKLDLSSFDTKNVDNIASMFSGTPLEELKLGRNFILKETITTNGFEFNIPKSVKIITTRNIADRIKQIKNTFTENNFEIIN